MALVRLSVVVLGTYLALGCNKETPPAAEEPRSASNAATAQPATGPVAATSPASAAAGATDAAPAGVAKVTDPAFELSVDAPKAALKAGQAGSLDVVLVAKAPFHVNDKYPIKLKLKETPGIKYQNLTVGKESAKVEHMKAVVPVSFTPESAGKRSVAGQLAFSVCTEDKCLMEKRDLALDVVVE
jgi:hypothetical protein